MREVHLDRDLVLSLCDIQAGSSSVTSWMLASSRFAARSHSVRDRTTFARRMVFGLLSVCYHASDFLVSYSNTQLFAAWLNIIAYASKKTPNTGIKELLLDHYNKYGRSFFSR